MKTEMLKFERIRNLRVDNDLTQQKVAQILGVSQVQVSRLEKRALERRRRDRG